MAQQPPFGQGGICRPARITTSMESDWIVGVDACSTVVQIRLDAVYDMLPICPAVPLCLCLCPSAPLPPEAFPLPCTGNPSLEVLDLSFPVPQYLQSVRYWYSVLRTPYSVLTYPFRYRTTYSRYSAGRVPSPPDNHHRTTVTQLDPPSKP